MVPALTIGWLDAEVPVTTTEPVDLDRALVTRAQGGDREAFEQLVRRHQRGVWHLARRYLRADADASDVTQLAFVRAYRALDGFRGDASVRSWLYRIAINLALNHLRDRAREQPAEIADDALVTGATGTSRLEDAERAAALRAAIAALPPRQKQVLELRIHDELSFREVAAVCDCTENAAKVNFHLAVKRLRTLLGTDPVTP
ncbi:MAG: sigma-70 family RNA polymerase sigma factor [Kofleriaceae bacterium]